MGGPISLRTLEPVAGGSLVVLVLADVFLTVLYARMGTGIVSARLARVTWTVFRGISKAFGRRRGTVLSFCGPTILVLLVLIWGLLLTLGSALVIHPYLGTSVRANIGPTPGDFVSAMYAGANSIAIIGPSNFGPKTGPFQIFYLFNSLMGLCVLSLTLAYLMQIYIALHRRNTLGLTVYLQSGRTNDAGELIAGLGPGGRFNIGYVEISKLAGDIAAVKEAHHFYPVLFYFRFNETYYSVSMITIVALDTASLIRTALDEREYAWLQQSGAVSQLWHASVMLIDTLEHTFLPGGAPQMGMPEPKVQARWRLRYLTALRRLQAAGIRTAADEEAGAEAYIALRAQWDNYVKALAPTMLYRMGDIDLASSRGDGPTASAA